MPPEISLSLHDRSTSNRFRKPMVGLRPGAGRHRGRSNTLTNAMVIWVELSLLCVLAGALLLLDPLITLFAIGYFGLIGIVMNQTLKGWAASTGKVMAETDWESNVSVQDGIATYREITVANRRQYYIDRFRTLRHAGSEAYADQQFIGYSPRYGMEVALVVGAVLLVATLLQLRHRGTPP